MLVDKFMKFLKKQDPLIPCGIHGDWLIINEVEISVNKLEKFLCEISGGELIDKIKEDIKDWRRVADSEETPKLPGEGFEKGWRLGINRVCDTIERIIKTNEQEI